MTTSSVSAAPTVSLGNAQDVSGLVNSSVGLSLAEAVTTKVQPYLDQATALQTEINTNHTQIAAYQSMQSLLSALQSAASNLTTESLQGTNVFQARAANLSTNGTTAAASILTASVANNTDVGTHTVQVTQLASTEADTSDTLALASGDPISQVGVGAGTITIAETGKTSPQAVTISASMTLSQVAAAINAASTANGVSASVVSVDSSHQVLVLSAQDADTPISFTDPNSILQAMGVISGPTTSSQTGTIDDPVGQAGTFTIRGGSDSVPVTITAGDDLTTMVNEINAAAAGTEISASVVAGPRIQINDASNNPLFFSNVTGNALSSLGLTASNTVHQVTAPQALTLTVDGVAGITRDSNTVSDVLSGVTLNITQTTAPGTSVTVGIAPNANTAATAIQSFVTAYNSWEGFVQQNEATDSSGAAAASAVLFGDSTLREASLEVDSSITQSIGGTSLGALGISLDGNNNMQIDATTLDDALNDNFQTVANLFQSSLASSSPNLVPSGSNLSSFNGDVQFTIGMTGSNIGSLNVQANGQDVSTNFIFAGNTIQGLFGTPYSGMYFTYNGTGETATVTSTQGIGNQLYDTANKYANTTSGTVQSLVVDKQTQDLQFTSQYNNWVNEANNYTNFLLNQYSSLTSKIQAAGQTLNTLTALMNAQYSSNG